MAVFFWHLHGLTWLRYHFGGDLSGRHGWCRAAEVEQCWGSAVADGDWTGNQWKGLHHRTQHRFICLLENWVGVLLSFFSDLRLGRTIHKIVGLFDQDISWLLLSVLIFESLKEIKTVSFASRSICAPAEDNIFVTGAVGAAFDSNTYYGNTDAFFLKVDTAGRNPRLFDFSWGHCYYFEQFTCEVLYAWGLHASVCFHIACQVRSCGLPRLAPPHRMWGRALRSILVETSLAVGLLTAVCLEIATWERVKMASLWNSMLLGFSNGWSKSALPRTRLKRCMAWRCIHPLATSPSTAARLETLTEIPLLVAMTTLLQSTTPPVPFNGRTFMERHQEEKRFGLVLMT